MGKIVAIGGGEIGRPGYQIETLKIDKEIVKLSNKEHPRLLFIPTASFDSDGYIEVVKKYFGNKLGCKISVLKLTEKPSRKNIKNNVLSADIVYVGGGNTKFILQQWRSFGLDKILIEAYNKGVILAGVSAGAICWFQYANSDSLRLSGSTHNPYIRLKGLGLIKGIGSPHHIREKDRTKGLKNMVAKYGGRGIALDDYAALIINDGRVKIIISRPRSKITKIFKKGEKIISQVMTSDNAHSLL